jgi:polysaccharide export outer membrane protein
VCAVAIAVLSWVPGAVRAQQLAGVPAANLVLRPGDSIKLTVWKVPELNGEFPVAPDGTLAHPAFPTLVVAGVPLQRVQRMLDSAARVENVGARVVMQPLLHVVVSGEVRSPNLYKFPAGTSVFEAVVLAGGRTERANLSRLELFRNGESILFDLTDASGPATRAGIMSGDQMRLDREASSFRESVLPLLTVVGTLASITTLILRHR